MAYDFMENFDKNNTRFKDEISKYIDENIRKEGHIVLGETPPVLALAGADTKLPLVIPYEQINHIIDKHYSESNNYGILEKEDTLKLYESIINPVCLISGSEKDTCVVITDFKNKNGVNIQVPVFFNIDQDEIKVSVIATQYPNRTLYEYIAKEIIKHNLIAYHNKKLEDLLRPIGLLLPVGHTSSSSKNNIPQMIKNVNSYDDKIVHNLDSVKYVSAEPLFRIKANDNKFFKPIFKANFKELNEATNDLGLGDATIYFRYGEELGPVLKDRIMWNSKNFGPLYTTKQMGQIANRLIENKTKEIEEKLKEIKSVLKVKEDIKDSVLKFLNETSFTFEDKYGISLDQKLVGYCEETDREDLVYRICNEMQIDVLEEEALLAKYYSDIPNVTIDNVYDTFYKDCHAVVDEMYKQSKENITKIRKEIKNYIEGLKEVKGGGNIQQAQKIIEAYYETTTFYEAPENIKEVEEHIKNRLKNLFERFKDDKMILGLNTTEKENSHWNEYYKRDFEKYDKLLDATYCIIWTASHQSKVEYKKNANPEPTIYDQVIEECANADIHSTLEEDAKNKVAEMEVVEKETEAQMKEAEKEGKSNGIDEYEDDGLVF